MKRYLFIALIALSGSCESDKYIDAKKLPVPDCTGESTIAKVYFKNERKILVIPDHLSDSLGFKESLNPKNWGYDSTLVKRESELIDKDFEGGLHIYGLIRDFKNWDKFGVQFKQYKNGFEFNGKRFTHENDGFFYISEKRMVYSGNSMATIRKPQSTYATYYKYMLFENGLLSKLCISDTAIIDVKKLRETNYNYTSTKYFDLYIDRKIGKIHIIDSIVTDICEKVNLKLPDFKINAFIHDDPHATRIFTNFFFMTGCDTLKHDMEFGTVQIDGIHSTGKDVDFVRHETFHYLWKKLVGENHGQEFFNEGIQEYYQQLLDTSRVVNNVQVLKRHQNYDITNLVTRGNMQDFWGSPSENNWPISYNISGLFVKYMIDKEGIDTFKDFFTTKDKTKAFVHFYKMTDKEMIKEFNEWINKI